MKWILKFVFVITMSTNLWAVGEAGAVFLLIAPGAGPAATGEAQVAKVDDAYASYYNPAGLAFLPGSELALMHVNWLPSLADDLYYEFLAYRRDLPGLGVLGGHVVFLDLGEQTRTDEYGNVLGTFSSNMWALSTSFGTLLNNRSSIGISAKIFHQNLTNQGVVGESGKGKSTDFAFDIGYLWKSERFNFGTSIANIGPKISFIDDNQADPAPTNMRIGIKYDIFKNEFNRLELLFDMSKMLVASYPAMDWDGDGIIGGYDDSGHFSPGSEFNKDGQEEAPHSDSWLKALVTSWLDDWYLGGDLDKGGWSANETSDNIIGGYDWDDLDGDGEVYQYSYYSDGQDQYEYINGPDCPECEVFVDEAGKYNQYGIIEKGTGKDRKFSTEFKEMVYNIGAEYWYTDNFVLRAGYIYDYEGKIQVPTFGAGIHLGPYGFDFGYTYAEEGHPRANTMYFSLNMKL